MTAILIATTVIAVVVAVAAGIGLFVAFRNERRRSDARVAALRVMAATAGLVEDEIAPAPSQIDDLGTYDDELARPMFGEAEAPSPWGRRVAAAAVVAAIAIAAGYVLLPGSGTISSETSDRAAETAVAPLELLSLRHTQEDGRLIITGLVQNPRTGAPLTRVIATGFLFGADGSFLASGRAPLDFSTLAAGDESPFVLTVPVKAAVARYRVGFRGEDGRVIGHVDRRFAGTLARTGE